ncbi:hypothetical protein [Aliiroseovarius sp.]|uniref:hypothetical protein n=1 Tax=Aliiroseovarius sp. TaxID=1872442 RepID=UPI003BAB4CBC
MDITPVLTQHSAAPNRPPAATPAPTEAFSIGPATGPTKGPEAIAAIKSRYDMTNITPRQVDQLVSELQDAGHEFGAELLTLMTYGEEFQSHLARTFGGEPQPHRAMNLIEHGKAQLDYARRAGDPTEHWQMFLEYLDGFGTPDSPEERTVPRSDSAQRLVETRMTRS